MVAVHGVSGSLIAGPMKSATLEFLDHRTQRVAEQIFGVFQRSYQVEADLIGITRFPPLRRNVTSIQESDTIFLGHKRDDRLLSTLEYAQHGATLNIASLVVLPEHFRCGLASELLRRLFGEARWSAVSVDTAAVNLPALSLYRKFGFSEVRRWRTVDGIEKLRLTRRKATI